MTIAQRIQNFELAITKEQDCLLAILLDNCAQVREQIIDEDEQDLYDVTHKHIRVLQEAKQRIESILNSSEQYIANNCK